MLKKLLCTLLMGAALSSQALAATEGTDYKVLPKEIPQAQKDKVEVLEFFGYFCIHCKNLDPVMLKHVKTFAPDTYFRGSHVVWDKERDMGLARLAAAVEQSGLKHSANPAIFNAIFNQSENLSDPENTKKWIAAQKSFNSKKLLAAYNAFGAETLAKQMEELTATHGIGNTPTVVVGGKYQVLFPNGYAAAMQTIDELVAKVREERGMKAVAAKPKAAPPKSKGAGIAASVK